MGYLYRPRLKDATPPPEGKTKRCTHERHGREDVCPKCGARFSRTWWAKYYVNGTMVRESTETEKETEARAFLKRKEGDAANGRAVAPRMDRLTYDEAATDLRDHYKVSAERDLDEAEHRFKHLDPFFRTARLSAITRTRLTAYAKTRQAEGAANGTINRELGVLRRIFALAVENEKYTRALPRFRKLKETAPRRGFFEREEFEAVKRHLSADLQVVVSIQYAFGWRTKSEVLSLLRNQVDLNACTIRLEPGSTKNDEGRLVYLTPELVAMLQAQDERIQILEMHVGKPVPYLFPHFTKRHRGKRIQDFRPAWQTACLEAMLDQEGLEGTAREQRRRELRTALTRGERPGLLARIRHDFRRTAVRNMVNRGVSEGVAMTVTGHRTRAVFERYHIVSPKDLQEVARKLTGTFSGTLRTEKEQGVPCNTGTT